MILTEWIFLALTALAAAASPGPSFALLVRSVMAGGRTGGIIFGISHGFGIFIYAALVGIGLAGALLLSPLLFKAIQIGGLIFLIWLGVTMIAKTHGEITSTPDKVKPTKLITHARDGLLIALLNPKAAVFLTAIFSQFIEVSDTIGTRVGVVVLLWAVDSSWYVLAGIALALTPVMATLHLFTHSITKIMGTLLIVLALIIGYGIIAH